MRSVFSAHGAVLALAAVLPAHAESTAPLEEIVVTAALRGEDASELPSSVTVLDEATIRAAGLQHFADVMALVPNLNWSGGSSRPRYLQLRGIGELEQYQGAPNPSVAFLIDDFDFSGIGMPATTFDVEQIEVLRGPQGARQGANALAGLVKLKTRDADGVAEVRTEFDAGDDAMLGIGIGAGGRLPGVDTAAWRIAAQHYSQDGFRHNAYLDRDDTNGRDELTLRGKLRLQLGDDWRADVATLYAEIDNGFDAFAPDNSLRTLSDRPGRDAQRSRGLSLALHGDLGAARLQSTTAYVDSDIVYSFDGDWANDPYWGEFAPYDYFSRYARERSSLSQDLRLLAGEDTDRRRWLVGVYALRLEEDTLQRDSFAGDLLRPVLDSDFRATQLAPYAQFDWQVGDAVSLSAGLRLERRSADYRDSDGTTSSPVDTMLGGQLSASVDFGDSASWYSTLSRGYKAGGFNIGPLVPQDRREFEPEYLWNLESGLRHLSADASLRAELSVFYMRREQQQVASSFQLDPGDPLSYLFLVDNAARGRNYGLEGAVDWQAGRGLRLGGTLGWLESEYLDYRYGGRDLDGRAMAHAPRWQYSLYADWRSRSGPGLRADLQGMDAFYFDTSHDRRSQAYALVNLRGGYFAERWSVTAWVRNAFDADRAVRGFYFGLEPPDYADTLYVQHGDPRQVGLSFELRWP